MNINIRELSILTQEADALSEKVKLSPQEKRRFSFLTGPGIAAVRQGATLAEVDELYLNENEERMGLPKSKLPTATQRESEKRAAGWQAFVNAPKWTKEQRDMVEGAPMINHLGTYTGLGYFVPTGFYPQLFAAMAAHDVLFDEDSCTVIKTDNGEPFTIPIAGDIENVATILSESSSAASVDLYSTGHAKLGAYTYRNPRFVVSLESFDDVSEALNVEKLFKAFSSDRMARGIGADLLTGNGVSKTLGLIPSLYNLGVTPVTAIGSSSNTGGTETGATSLGSNDFAAALQALDSAYTESEKCAWVMNRRTLATVSSIVDKYGNLLNLVKYVSGRPEIFGIPVKISPSMQNVGASATPVILGDFSYWSTRLVIDDKAGIAVIKEAPGLIENGNIGLTCFGRADGALLYSDTGSPSPFVLLQNHS